MENDEKLLLTDENGVIIANDYKSEEDAGVDLANLKDVTKEDIRREGNIVDKFLTLFMKK